MEYRFHPWSVLRTHDASEEILLKALKATRTAYEEASPHTRRERREKYRQALHEFLKYTLLKTAAKTYGRENAARVFGATDIAEQGESADDSLRQNHDVPHSEPAIPTSRSRSKASQKLMNPAETVWYFEPRNGVHLILHFSSDRL